MPRSNQGNRGRNNNPSGRNQYSSDFGVMEIARERPFAAAATAAAAVGAGVFLWSRRNQISDQISNLSEQFGEWTQNFGSSGSEGQFAMGDDTAGLTTTGPSSFSGSTTKGSTGRKSRTTSRRTGMSETGGGNASLGARSGGGGSLGSPSGRGRARSQPIT